MDQLIKSPRLPFPIARPLSLLPERLQSLAAAQALNRVFARERLDGDLDFLDDRCIRIHMDDADICIAAYGTTARICKTAIQVLRAEGLKVGMIRPITLYPFPHQAFREAAESVEVIFDVEMSMGQMIEDVRIAVGERVPIRFYGRVGGMVPTPGEIADEVRSLAEEVVR